MPLVLKDLLSNKAKVGFVYVEIQENRGTRMSPVLISLRVSKSDPESEGRSSKACRCISYKQTQLLCLYSALKNC